MKAFIYYKSSDQIACNEIACDSGGARFQFGFHSRDDFFYFETIDGTGFAIKVDNIIRLQFSDFPRMEAVQSNPEPKAKLDGDEQGEAGE